MTAAKLIEELKDASAKTGRTPIVVIAGHGPAYEVLVVSHSILITAQAEGQDGSERTDLTPNEH